MSMTAYALFLIAVLAAATFVLGEYVQGLSAAGGAL